MKSNKRTTLATLIALFCAFAVDIRAAVIVDDAAITPPPNQFLTLTQSIPPGQGLFAISIEPLGSSQFRFSYAGIAEEYGLYAVSFGTAFDPAFALSMVPLVSNNGIDPGSSVQLFNLGQSIYFGYWDDRNFDSVPDSNDNYGWVLITRDAAGLVASSSATAIGGGIVVGSTVQIPEPASAALISFGAILLICSYEASCRQRRDNIERRSFS